MQGELPDRTVRLRVAGVALRGDGYPNAGNTIALLAEQSGWDVSDHADWLPPQTRLWHLVRGPLRARLALAARLAVGGFVQALEVLSRARRSDLVYLPYPAPLSGWWLSFVPARWRPRCIADAYISLWDTMFRDRAAGTVDGMASRLTHWFERRALRAMSMVLVDTEANRRQMVQDFDLSPARVRSIPLAIDATPFASAPASGVHGTAPLKVLFVGTLVPLHGIEVVLEAASRLSEDADITFRIVGDGQQGDLVEDFLRRRAPRNLTWVREWQSLESIAGEFAAADVCLGVFGGAGKAARVLPFKAYYALAAGRVLVTQAGHSLPQDVPPLPAITVVGSDARAAASELSSVLRTLARERDDLRRRGLESRRYYEKHLSRSAIAAAWTRISEELGARQGR